jgi:phosphonate transport system permease protein
MSVAVPAAALPSRKFRQTIVSLIAITAGICLLFAYLDVSPSSFFVDFRFLADLLHQMLPPNFALLWTDSAILVSLVETLSMAFLATVLGGVLALFLSFFAATNTTLHPLMRLLARTLLAMSRSAPHLIVILVLLIAIGIGPFAGMLSLILGTVGMFGKFFADSIEHAEKGILESVQSVGSTRLQTIRYAVLPQVMPSFVANLFYAFDQNLRVAVPLGVFGGGGIGFQLEVAKGLLHFKDVLMYTALIVVMITVMERISDWVRRKILTQPMLIAK